MSDEDVSIENVPAGSLRVVVRNGRAYIVVPHGRLVVVGEGEAITIRPTHGYTVETFWPNLRDEEP